MSANVILGRKRPMGMSFTNRNQTVADDAHAILNRIRQLVQTLRSFDKEAQARSGIGAAQMFILHVLQQEADLTMNELAERTATDQSSVSLAVRRLVEEGYVHREPGAEDRRQVRLSLTTKGRTLSRRSPPAAQEKIMESVETMTRADRAQLLALLGQLMSGMDSEIERLADAAPPPARSSARASSANPGRPG
jgi:DNA-binding MarR family transcriptional regulator